MRKNVKFLWMAAAAAVLAPPCALAEDVTVKAKIPFDFQVGEQQLPSGHYRFVTRADPQVLLVYSVATGDQLTAVHFNGRLEAERSPWAQLTFHRHGDQHFLKSIRGLTGPAASLAEMPSEARAEAEAEARAVAASVPTGAGPKAKTALP